MAVVFLVVASPKAKILVASLLSEVLHACRNQIRFGDRSVRALLYAGHVCSYLLRRGMCRLLLIRHGVKRVCRVSRLKLWLELWLCSRQKVRVTHSHHSGLLHGLIELWYLGTGILVRVLLVTHQHVTYAIESVKIRLG